MKKLVNVVAAIGALAYAVFITGFWFHKSWNPQLFGRYSIGCLAGLLVLTAFIPGVFLLVRRLLTPGHIITPSGKRIAVTVSTKLLLLLLLVVGFVVVAEHVLSRRARKQIVAERQFRLKDFHPYLQVAPAAGDASLNINRWGFRGRDIEKAKPANTFRIFVIGGSTVFCEKVPFEASHCRVLEKLLAERYPQVNIEVQNAGMHWHTSLHSVIKWVSQVQSFDPDLVIVYHAINDLYRSFSPTDFADGPYRDDYGHYYGPLARMVRNYGAAADSGSRLLSSAKRTLGRVWYTDFAASGGSVVPVALNEWPSLVPFRRNMRTFCRLVRDAGSEVIIASQPYLYRADLNEAEADALVFPAVFCVQDGRYPDTASMIRGMNAFNAVAAAVAEAESVLFVDLEKAIPKDLDHFVDDVHYTVRGNDLVARTFAREIVRLELIASPVTEEQP